METRKRMYSNASKVLMWSLYIWFRLGITCGVHVDPEIKLCYIKDGKILE